MKRILIVGCAGTGKTTLALRISGQLGLPVIHSDQFFWLSGWVQRPDDAVKQLVENVIKEPQWIFEGNNFSTLPQRLARADTLIYLQMPTWLNLYRVIFRMMRSYGKTRDGFADGCPEQLNGEFLRFLLWVYRYNKTEHPDIMRKLGAVHSSTKIVYLRSAKAVDDFVANLPNG